MGIDNRVVLIEEGKFIVFYDSKNIKVIDVEVGNVSVIEGIDAITLSNILYKRYSELNENEIKIVEELPFLDIEKVDSAEDKVLVSMVHEIEEEIANTYGLSSSKIDKRLYTLFSLRKHLWIAYQQGYLLPISLGKGYSMINDLLKSEKEFLCLGDDDLMGALVMLESDVIEKIYVVDIDDSLLRFYKNVVKSLVHTIEVNVTKKDFTKIKKIDILHESRRIVSFTNPPTDINTMKKFLKLAAKHSKFTLLPSSLPHIINSVISRAKIYRLSPLSAFSLRFTAANDELIIDTTHIAPIWMVIKW